MNELLTLVHDFNTQHKADVFFNYAGHVDMVHVTVNAPDTKYVKDEHRIEIFDARCYLDVAYGQYPTIEALTEAFRKFAEGYQE